MLEEDDLLWVGAEGGVTTEAGEGAAAVLQEDHPRGQSLALPSPLSVPTGLGTFPNP